MVAPTSSIPDTPALAPQVVAPPVTAEPEVPAVFATIQALIDAGRPMIYIQSSEEDRVIGVLGQIAQERRGGARQPLPLERDRGPPTQRQAVPDPARRAPRHPRFHRRLRPPRPLSRQGLPRLIHDLPDIRRRLRDLYYECLDTGKFAFLCSPVKCIPEEINREVAFTELPRPDLKELEQLLSVEAKSMAGAVGDTGLSRETIYLLTRAVQGLSFHEARHALRHAMSEHGKLDTSIVRMLEQEKHQLVRKTGLIEYVPNTTGIEQIGGLDVLKTLALPAPRPVLLPREPFRRDRPQGPPPHGRLRLRQEPLAPAPSPTSSACPSIASTWFRSSPAGIGSAERLFSFACRTMEDVSPAVAWFDEIEAGISREHQDETGVLDRIFGFFLTWMQEKAPGLFVVATANRIDLLPAEMIRKGRFDQVFFIDLPDL